MELETQAHLFYAKATYFCLQDAEVTLFDVCKFKCIHKCKFTYGVCLISAFWLAFGCILPVLVCFDCIPVASDLIVLLFLRTCCVKSFSVLFIPSSIPSF